MLYEELVLKIINPGLIVWIEFNGLILWSLQLEVESQLVEVDNIISNGFYVFINSGLNCGRVCCEDFTVIILLWDGQFSLAVLNLVQVRERRVLKGIEVLIFKRLD